MDSALQTLWLIPALPLLAAGIIAVMPRSQRAAASALAIGAMAVALLLSLRAFLSMPGSTPDGPARAVFNFQWMQMGSDAVSLGWVLDPLTGVMLAMVSFVSLLIFIYSTGYMAHDENYKQFFCFLSLFAAAMLGVVIANSLLMFFMCWEVVGLASYLLIGFWFHKPSAAAAAKKAFITTRVGDVFFFLGILFLYSQAHTLLFYDHGNGCLEGSKLTALAAQTTVGGLALTTGIGLLIFCGAVGKSGQVPLHVWLPDAMEGPTPVSALIHAATMVAAGVFLVARVYPLMAAHQTVAANPSLFSNLSALSVVAWVGAITAVFAASIAVAQTDIKRILAYSTVSQLGFMMLGLGVGGVAVGIFHLITHAFFKALLFLGAGSVIHGCHEEQDIRHMGGLRKWMPITFATYSAGMLALAGFPIVTAGFWSKDGILHAAREWEVSRWPLYLAIFGAFLTAFYMTRQMYYVFFGECRGGHSHDHSHPHGSHDHDHHGDPHESPGVMTGPLAILAIFAVFLGFVGTPAWPRFQDFLEGRRSAAEMNKLFESGVLSTMGMSALIFVLGAGLGWWIYGRSKEATASETDPLERSRPDIFTVLKNKYYIDELYESTVIAFNAWFARFCDALDFWVWNGAVQLFSYSMVGLSWVSRSIDEFVVNLGFNLGCREVGRGGRLITRLQSGQIQNYLRVLGIALAVLAIILMLKS